jgi:hypothetical protein
MCIVILPPGGYPIAVKKCIISYIISYQIFSNLALILFNYRPLISSIHCFSSLCSDVVRNDENAERKSISVGRSFAQVRMLLRLEDINVSLEKEHFRLTFSQTYRSNSVCVIGVSFRLSGSAVELFTIAHKQIF